MLNICSPTLKVKIAPSRPNEKIFVLSADLSIDTIGP